MGRRHLGEALTRGAVLESSRDTREYLKACLRDQTREVFCGLFLDNRHRVIAFEELFAGAIDACIMVRREIDDMHTMGVGVGDGYARSGRVY